MIGSVFRSVGGISKILGRVVGRSSPAVIVIIVIVVVLVLRVLVIDNLGRVRLFQIEPKLDDVEDQGDDSDEEEF